MIEIKTEAYPKKGLKAICKECGFVVIELEWDTYHDYQTKKSKLRKKYSICTKCGAANGSGPRWERLDNGDWSAKCANGDFLIWKYGRSYKWRYRHYGGEYADQVGFSATLDQAKGACMRHEEWKTEGAAV